MRHTMLFNSPEFVLGFMPAVLAGFFLAGRFGGTRWALRWLVAASFFFYGWWNPRFILLLAGSILGNYAIAQRILRLTCERRTGAAHRWLVVGIAANLALLGWFKYANFLIHDVLQLNTPELQIFLPLAISFFTFQQRKRTLYLSNDLCRISQAFRRSLFRTVNSAHRGVRKLPLASARRIEFHHRQSAVSGDGGYLMRAATCLS